jgi:glutamate synthase (NADPH/NADH) small chain
VVVAIGNGANPLLTEATPELKLNKWGNIVADEATGRTSMPGVYAGGDIVIGAATVILAMGAGKQAALAIHEEIMAREVA